MKKSILLQSIQREKKKLIKPNIYTVGNRAKLRERHDIKLKMDINIYGEEAQFEHEFSFETRRYFSTSNLILQSDYNHSVE